MGVGSTATREPIFFNCHYVVLQLNGDQNCYLNLNDCEVYFLWMENTCVQFDNYTVFGFEKFNNK